MAAHVAQLRAAARTGRGRRQRAGPGGLVRGDGDGPLTAFAGRRIAGNRPVIEALVQSVTLTGDRAAAIEEISAGITGASAENVARTPFLLIGSHEQMAAQLIRQ